MVKVLRNSGSIRRAIVRLMQPGRARRVAVVAFVGAGASAYIPRPRGVEIVCWPRAGGTNPAELRSLKMRGANIRFADNLHMKLYWAEGRGAVITSANLTTNALGAGSLKEFGILTTSHAIDIDAVLRSINSRRFNLKDMHKLEQAHRKWSVQHDWRPDRQERIEFLKWLSLPARPDWKLGWYDDESGQLSSEAMKRVREDFNVREEHDHISCCKLDYVPTDWVLQFRLDSRGASKLAWMFVDLVAKIARTDKEAYDPEFPYQAVQVQEPRHYPIPPFAITPEFRIAFHGAVTKLGVGSIKRRRTVRPSSALLRLIASEVRQARCRIR